MKKCLKIHIKQKLETKNDNVVADVAQCERSKIKCYASAFSNILIRLEWIGSELPVSSSFFDNHLFPYFNEL